jgi:hypothetical protein
VRQAGDTGATFVHLGGKRSRDSPVSTSGNISRNQGPAKREKFRGVGTGTLGEQAGAKGVAASSKPLEGGVSLENVCCGICGNRAEDTELQGDLWVCGSCGRDLNTWSEEGVRMAEGVAVPQVKVRVIPAQKPVISGQSSLGAQERPSREPENTRGNRREMSPAAGRRSVSGIQSPVGNGRGRSITRFISVQKQAESVSRKSGVSGGGNAEGFTAQSLPEPNEHVQYFDQGSGVNSWVQATVISLDYSIQPPGVSVQVGQGERVVDTELGRLRRCSPTAGGGQSSADTVPDFSGVSYQGGSAAGFGGGFKTVKACGKFLEYLGGGDFAAKAKVLVEDPPAVWTATTRKSQKYWTGALCILTDLLGQTELWSAEHGVLFNLILLLPMLLRRRTGRVGELTSSVNRRNERRMMHNCELLRGGRLEQLLDDAIRAGEAAANHARERVILARRRTSGAARTAVSDTEWARKVNRAEELARRGNLSKGFATLTQPGLAAHNAVEELKAKHPVGPAPSAEHEDRGRWEEEPGPLKPEEVKRAIMKSATAGAADRFGWCIREDLQCLFAKLSAPEPGIFTAYILLPFLRGTFPKGALDPAILWGGTLLALSKAPKPGSRPVVIGLALRRVTLKAVMPRYRKDLEGYFLGEHPRVKQFAAGVQDGATRAFKYIQQLLDDLETDDGQDPVVAMALDATNAFNCLSRQTLFDTLAGIAQQHYDAGLLGEVKPGEELPFTTEILRTLNPMLKECYTDPAMVRHFSSALGEAVNLAVSRGVQQGDVLGSVLWCLAMHPVLCRVMERHEDVHCVAFADNVWCVGRLSDVLPATKDLATAMETTLTVSINMAESYIYAPAFQRDNTLQVSAGIAALGEELGPLVQSLLKGMGENRSGVSVLGVPLGSDDYIKTFLHTKVQRFLADFPSLNKLTDFKVYINFVRFCLAPRLHYLLRAIDPALSLEECASMDVTIQSNLLKTMGWETFDPPALEGYEGENLEQICVDATGWSHYYIFGSLARGSLGIPRAEDVARPAFYCATVDYVTAIAALDHPLRDLECPSLQANSRLLQQLAEAHQKLLDIGCEERDQHLENSAPSSGLREVPSSRPPPALTRLCDLHSLGVKLYTNPNGLLSQTCGRGGGSGRMQVDEREDHLQSCVRKSVRSQIRPEQRTIREFCFSKEFWVTQALASMPQGLKARMELRMPIVHQRLSEGSPLHQALVKVGVNIERFSVRTHTMSALYAVTGWEDPLSFSEWRLTGAYLFGFTSPTYNLAQTSDERRCPCGKELDVGGHHVQCCVKHARGSWIVGHNAVQAVWKKVGEEAGFTARVDVAHGLPRELHTAGRICDILYTPDHQNLRGMTPILADISLTHTFIGNAGDREQWGIYQGKGLCRRAQMKRLKHAWAENDHIVVPFVSDTLGSMSGESAVTLCLFAWCQAVLEAEFFVDDWGDGAGSGNSDNALVGASKQAFRRWDARLTLAVWRATAARATGPGVRVVKNWGSRRNGTAPFPEMGVFAPLSPFNNNE